MFYFKKTQQQLGFIRNFNEQICIVTLGNRTGLPRWLSGKRIPLPLQELQETWVQSLDQEDPLKEEMATHSCLENPMDRGAWWVTNPWGHKELDMTETTEI